ncbi:MAG: hypothetical protein JRH16_17745 [Deltaproteobacteria bacterium]|nr:hypothetical protein [Deltaproteobacteria bacterium]MBW2361035.1 hypothetical protein [Deltaproteobacteria bacterium]
MNDPLEQRMLDAVRGSALDTTAAGAAAAFRERAGDPDALARVEGRAFTGVARALAARHDAARFLANRPVLVDRLAKSGADSLRVRSDELRHWRFEDGGEDLEAALDAVRLLRREETLFATCLQLAGWADLDAFSGFLSLLAETITQRCLELARGDATTLPFSVIAMGKIGGREFTHESDLDLLFLYEGGAATVAAASRVGQRLVTYLSTMTGAGIAYSVDARLRPSGGQGMLVTSQAAFEAYQRNDAQTWEHVAMLRARPIAGNLAATADALDRVRADVRAAHPPPWPELAEMRARVEAERAAPEGSISLKTGPGGTMDIDFLAGGAMLERGEVPMPALPSVPALLRAACGADADGLLEAYALLRRAEASVRWLAGRAVEAIEADQLDATAELTEPGLSGEVFATQLRDARTQIRASYDRVISAASIAAVAGG